MLNVFKPFANSFAFPIAANQVIGLMLSQSKGEITMGPLEVLLMSLPDNEIVIPPSVTLNYASEHRHKPWIANKRMHGYFEGDIDGMGSEEINDAPYGLKGDMQLSDDGPPFEFQISNRLINNMFHVLLAREKVHVRSPYQSIMKYKPPFDWTSTQLEGAIPNLCDTIGYDVPLSLVFVNDGAPLFKFHPEEMSIKFNMDVQVWDEGFTKNFMDVHFE